MRSDLLFVFGLLLLTTGTAIEPAVLAQDRLADARKGDADPKIEPEKTETSSDAPDIGVLNDKQGESAIRQGPEILKANRYGVGQMVPDVSFKNLDGQTNKLSNFRDRKAVVIAFTGTGCPLCLKYAPTLASLEKEYRARGIEFIFINPNESESDARLKAAIDSHGLSGPYVRDSEMSFARALGATRTTEVFVLDQARTLVYRGAVDDQYGFGYSLNEPRRNYLREALNGVLDGQPVSIGATSSPGCDLYYDNANELSAEGPSVKKPRTQTAVTYHNQIARVIQANCIECHRDGGIAPIAFESYQQVRDYAAMIRSVVDREIMPPWFAVDSSTKKESGNTRGHTRSRWANERSLSASEKADLFAWIDGGTPEGDPNDAPVERVFPDGWLIGNPDVVYEFEKPVPVKATGTMPYRNVTVETDLEEDKWVRAIEVRPGNPEVVHHVIVSVRGPDGRVDERDGFWGVYVPGNSILAYPDGYAKRLPKGTELRFQMHYTPNGTATEDSTRIGLVFADEPPKYEVKVKGIANVGFNIPAGEGNYAVTKNHRVEDDVEVLGYLPHMHLRGKAARYEVLNDDGEEKLLDIPRYDFNWQLLYRLSEPLLLRRGDTIRFTAWYDNSKENPANPDPTRNVGWGQQTEDEMHIGYVEYVVPIPKSDAHSDGSDSGDDSNRDFDAGLFERLDLNDDDLITRQEVRRALPKNKKASGPIFDGLDRNQDDQLDKEEFSRLQRSSR